MPYDITKFRRGYYVIICMNRRLSVKTIFIFVHKWPGAGPLKYFTLVEVIAKVGWCEDEVRGRLRSRPTNEELKGGVKRRSGEEEQRGGVGRRSEEEEWRGDFKSSWKVKSFPENWNFLECRVLSRSDDSSDREARPQGPSGGQSALPGGRPEDHHGGRRDRRRQARVHLVQGGQLHLLGSMPGEFTVNMTA